MLRIGVTGQSGFIGSHLYNTLGRYPDRYERIPFQRVFFDDRDKLRDFAAKCDVVIHLAGLNRSDLPGEIYETNTRLAELLAGALKGSGSNARLIFASSVAEGTESEYGRSKSECGHIFSLWARDYGGHYANLRIPNVFGPFARPYYNSFVATFCHMLVRGMEPEIEDDREIPLIYSESLVRRIIDVIDENLTGDTPVKEDFRMKVSEVLCRLERYGKCYLDRGIIPDMDGDNALNLFNTFRSYLDQASHFPVKLVSHTDDRGSFAEIIRNRGNGQSSFSVTGPGVTRGDHFHTRKFERFTILRGKCSMAMRRIGESEITEFELDGE